MSELYKKHRPSNFKEVVGQSNAVAQLSAFVKKGNIPHAMLFTGPSGCGKTTLARIMKEKLDCSDHDFCEQNSSDYRGIDSIREMRKRMGLAPVSGSCRIWLLDECHKLSNDAQNALLKILEDTPKHVYFMLATTDPQKLIKTVVNRCTQIKVDAVSFEKLTELVEAVCKKEGVKLPEEVVSSIANIAEGSARRSLVLLEQIIGLKTEEDQLEALQKSESKQQSIEIARALIKGVSWPEMCKLLKEVDDEPETIRHLILGYCTTIMLGGNAKMSGRASVILNNFRDNYYDCGKAGLVLSCYETLVGG